MIPVGLPVAGILTEEQREEADFASRCLAIRLEVAAIVDAARPEPLDLPAPELIARRRRRPARRSGRAKGGRWPRFRGLDDLELTS